MSSITPRSPSASPLRRTTFDVVIPILPRRLPETSCTPPVVPDGDEDDELSDETVARLLREAEERMRTAGSSAVSMTGEHNVTAIKLPKLNPGASLPKPLISSEGSVSRISNRTMLVPENERKLANSIRLVGDPTTNKKLKNEPPPTAGTAWYDLSRTEQTAEFKRDFALIKHRNVLDSHRHYRKDNSGIPQYSQMGTVIEGNTEFFNSRINRKDRKKTILDEILADGTSQQKFKKKFEEIQKSKRSGKKEFYKKLKEQRNKNAKFTR
ncbi:Fcf2 pre-rRNA processing-domain-containing protein [Trichophaea hybrida]|nr:Fcf2 pre-rRNA processing-domain-containing protein [Trichophaea hybrida]